MASNRWGLKSGWLFSFVTLVSLFHLRKWSTTKDIKREFRLFFSLQNASKKPNNNATYMGVTKVTWKSPRDGGKPACYSPCKISVKGEVVSSHIHGCCPLLTSRGCSAIGYYPLACTWLFHSSRNRGEEGEWSPVCNSMKNQVHFCLEIHQQEACR